MRAVLAGIGVREALGSVGAGTVTASFSKACYLDVAGTTVALVAPEVHPGPLHLLLDASPPRPRVGAPVTVDDSRVVVDGRAIELLGAAPWDGALPPDERVRARSATIARVAAAAATRSALRTEPFAGPAAIARDLVERGLLDDAARILAGLGPGFTPSGDDALAGVALGLRAAPPGSDDRRSPGPRAATRSRPSTICSPPSSPTTMAPRVRPPRRWPRSGRRQVRTCSRGSGGSSAATRSTRSRRSRDSSPPRPVPGRSSRASARRPTTGTVARSRDPWPRGALAATVR